MEKKENRGGYREGAGRKPSKDPLYPLYVSIRTSIITKLGGKESVRNMVKTHLEGKAKNT